MPDKGRLGEGGGREHSEDAEHSTNSMAYTHHVLPLGWSLVDYTTRTSLGVPDLYDQEVPDSNPGGTFATAGEG